MYGRMDSRIDQVEEDRASNRDFFPNFFPLFLSVSLCLSPSLFFDSFSPMDNTSGEIEF